MMRLSAPLVAGRLAGQLDRVEPPLVRQRLDVAVYRGDAERRDERAARCQDLVGAQGSSFMCEDFTYCPPLSGVTLHLNDHSFSQPVYIS